jgi:hypothetical protein
LATAKGYTRIDASVKANNRGSLQVIHMERCQVLQHGLHHRVFRRCIYLQACCAVVLGQPRPQDSATGAQCLQ